MLINYRVNKLSLIVKRFFPTIGWANALGAGSMEGAKGFMFFICDIELTESGLGKSSNVEVD
jgi:hypothetical protein